MTRECSTSCPPYPLPPSFSPPTLSPSSSWTTSSSPRPHTLDPHPIHSSVLHPPPYVLPQQPVVYVPSFDIRLVVRELPSANVVQRRYDLVVLTACTSSCLIRPRRNGVWMDSPTTPGVIRRKRGTMAPMVDEDHDPSYSTSTYPSPPSVLSPFPPVVVDAVVVVYGFPQ